MPTISVPGHGDVDFPDSMNEADITSALRKISPPPQPERQVGGGEAALSGLVQGMGMGWGDEVKAGWRSLFPKSLGGGDYKTTRDALRADNALAQKQHPYIYGGADMVGSALPAAGLAMATGGTSVAPTLARAALPLAAGQGAVQGAGYSNADSARGMASDAGLGAGLGVAGYGLGSVLGGAGRAVAGWARGKAGNAVGRASEQAAQEVADAIATAKGNLGTEVQKGSRYVENLMRLEQSMTPEQQALYASLHPEIQQLQQRVAQSTLEALPSQAGTIATKDAELAALKSGASEAFSTRKDELLQPQFLKDAASLAKSYAEPLAANAILGPGAGIVMGRTRAGKAIAARITRPGNQKAIADFLANSAEGPTMTLLRKALQAAPAPLTQELVGQ